VVPPNQAEIMYEGLRKRGLMTALVMYEGEQHGFRSAGAIRRTLDGAPVPAWGLGEGVLGPGSLSFSLSLSLSLS
jgi:hypothetical protein